MAPNVDWEPARVDGEVTHEGCFDGDFLSGFDCGSRVRDFECIFGEEAILDGVI
jgi:hypothetical protein